MTRILTLAASLAAAVLQMGAQPNASSLQGVVLDPSGSLVPRATVTVLRGQRSVGAGQSDATGHFWIKNVPPGSYAIRATAPGFAGFDLPSCTIALGGPQRLEIRLTVQSENSQVTVSDAVAVDVDPANNAGAIVLAKRILTRCRMTRMTWRRTCKHWRGRRQGRMAASCAKRKRLSGENEMESRPSSRCRARDETRRFSSRGSRPGGPARNPEPCRPRGDHRVRFANVLPGRRRPARKTRSGRVRPAPAEPHENAPAARADRQT